ncbi:hypothetical protein OHU11_01370 [Streptomyces sp. NBC_00257]|uniref:hypothetical protein n=1 Tax=unclassified Streptomyces TaxID=2593676 RepID=UPI0022556DAA|nr:MULTISPECIES: hypothetical protein [unclassified Streptomyces]MCX5426398.1 hypothetical protein [Streptomyces sp. NBC_00062]
MTGLPCSWSSRRGAFDLVVVQVDVLGASGNAPLEPSGKAVIRDGPPVVDQACNRGVGGVMDSGGIALATDRSSRTKSGAVLAEAVRLTGWDPVWLDARDFASGGRGGRVLTKVC